jgi:hypothetical protein
LKLESKVIPLPKIHCVTPRKHIVEAFIVLGEADSLLVSRAKVKKPIQEILIVENAPNLWRKVSYSGYILPSESGSSNSFEKTVKKSSFFRTSFSAFSTKDRKLSNTLSKSNKFPVSLHNPSARWVSWSASISFFFFDVHLYPGSMQGRSIDLTDDDAFVVTDVNQCDTAEEQDESITQHILDAQKELREVQEAIKAIKAEREALENRCVGHNLVFAYAIG